MDTCGGISMVGIYYEVPDPISRTRRESQVSYQTDLFFLGMKLVWKYETGTGAIQLFQTWTEGTSQSPAHGKWEQGDSDRHIIHTKNRYFRYAPCTGKWQF
jgi:hypothetical protein